MHLPTKKETLMKASSFINLISNIPPGAFIKYPNIDRDFETGDDKRALCTKE